MQRLQLTGIKAHILLKTTAQASAVKTNVLTGLEVSVITMTTFLIFWTTSCSGVKVQNTMSLRRKRGSTVDQYIIVLPVADA